MSKENLKAQHQRLTLELKDAVNNVKEVYTTMGRYMQDPDYYDLNTLCSFTAALQKHLLDARAKTSFIQGIEMASRELTGGDQ